MGRPKTEKGYTRTTIYILKKDIVHIHLLDIRETELKRYINRLIKEDILKNGSEEVIKKFFKE